MAGISFVSSKWSDIVNWLLPIANQNKVETIVGRLIVAAPAYYVRQERNYRDHGKSERQPDQVAKTVVDIVQLKLASIRFKRSTRVEHMRRNWKISCVQSDGG